MVAFLRHERGRVAPWCDLLARESDGSGRAEAKRRRREARGWSEQRDARSKRSERRSGSPKPPFLLTFSIKYQP